MVKKGKKEQDVLITVLASFHKMVNALVWETYNLVLWSRLTQDWGVSFLRENLWNTYKNKRVFYRHYITAAAHWKHWPTFLHSDLPYSSREGGGRRRGRTLLSQCSMAGGAGRLKKQESSLWALLNITNVSIMPKDGEPQISESVKLLGSSFFLK